MSVSPFLFSNLIKKKEKEIHLKYRLFNSLLDRIIIFKLYISHLEKYNWTGESNNNWASTVLLGDQSLL